MLSKDVGNEKVGRERERTQKIQHYKNPFLRLKSPSWLSKSQHRLGEGCREGLSRSRCASGSG